MRPRRALPSGRSAALGAAQDFRLTTPGHLSRAARILAAAALTSAGLIAAEAGPSRVPDLLMRRAESSGPVRVIVGFDAAARPEGDLRGRAEVERQRAGIARARTGLTAALAPGSFTVHREYETIPFVAIEATAEALRDLETIRGVRSIEEDKVMAPVLADSIGIVDADDAWAAGFTGTGWAVAVLDTGVDKSHSFLSGKVVSEACYSSLSSCPNGKKTQTSSGAGVPCKYAPFGCQHGTHVAGIATGSGTLFSGVAKGASIIAIQVFSRMTGFSCIGSGENPCALTSSSDVLAGLDRVLVLSDTFSIAAANLSIGGASYTSASACDADNTALKAAVDNLRSVGIATIVASGNESLTNAISVPACLSSAISVGATTKADVVASFSNSASYLSLLAPGGSITSSVPGGGFASFSGTSMAAPHVSGAWAIRRQSHPAGSVSDLLNDFRLTGVPITDGRNAVTTSRIDVGDALVTCDASADVTAGDAPLMADFTAIDGAGATPFTYQWDFDDGSGPTGGSMATHTFVFPGTYQVELTGLDDDGITCSDLLTIEAAGPRIDSVKVAGSPFRLIVNGADFEPGATIEIDGVAVPMTVFKSPTRVVAMKGAALKTMLPDNVAVSIAVINPGGVSSAPFSFTR